MVGSNPSGSGHPNPGSWSSSTSSRPNRATSGSHTIGVSGTPWTNTAVTAAPYFRFAAMTRGRAASAERGLQREEGAHDDHEGQELEPHLPVHLGPQLSEAQSHLGPERGVLRGHLGPDRGAEGSHL